MQEQQLRILKACKRSPELSNSTWYKGILTSYMARSSETEGAFDFVVSKMRAGTVRAASSSSCRSPCVAGERLHSFQHTLARIPH
jgi:hypothetical protein